MMYMIAIYLEENLSSSIKLVTASTFTRRDIYIFIYIYIMIDIVVHTLS